MKKTIRILALILAMLMLASCGEKAEIHADDDGDYVLTTEMSEKAKAGIDEVTGVFENAIATRSGADLIKYMDEGFKLNEEQLSEVLSSIAPEGKNPYELLDSYYVDNLEVSETSIRVKKSADDGEYIMVTPGSKEMYAAIYVSENDDISQAISLICAKISGDWKVVWLNASDYKYKGKDAQAFYDIMVKEGEAERDFTAYIYAQMMYNLCQPGYLLCYDGTTDMINAATEISAMEVAQFPMEFFDATRNIHTIGLAREGDEIIPMILYHTDVDIKNKEALNADAQKVLSEFLKEYPYMADEFAQIVMRATNVDPSKATEQYDVESVTLKTK